MVLILLQTLIKRQNHFSLLVEFYFLYTDGAARGNPGPSGAGWVLYNGQEDEVLSGHQFLGHRTNNQAEYEAVIYGLEAIADCEIENIVIRADSQLMVRQLLGEYRVKNVDLKPLHAKALQLLSLNLKKNNMLGAFTLNTFQKTKTHR